MTPEQADAFVADHEVGPAVAAIRARWQTRWTAWCGPRGQDPARAPGRAAAAWLATLRREDGGRLGPNMLSKAVLAVDALPERACLPALRQHPDVVAQIEAAARTVPRRQPVPVMTVPAARALLALPAPPPSQVVCDARAVLAAAARTRTSVPAAAAALAADLVLPSPKRAARAADALRTATGGPGQDLWETPARLPRPVLLAAWHRLDRTASGHARTMAGAALGLHCALTRSEAVTASRDGLRLSRRGLALSLPDGAAYARRADDPVLCAVRHVARWLRVAGPLPPGTPLLCALPDGPGESGPLAAAPLTAGALEQSLLRACARAGLPPMANGSLRLGYIAAADAQGRTVPEIAAGARLTSHDYAWQLVQQLRNRTSR